MTGAQPNNPPRIGDRMPDGTVYAGISPDTYRPLYARLLDAPLTMTWKQAADYAAAFDGHGQGKGAFRLPTKGELNLLFGNRTKIGGFNEAGPESAGWYWSSTKHRDHAGCAWDQCFRDGSRVWYPMSGDAAVRLVRG